MIVRPARKRKDTIRPAVLVDAGRAASLDDGTIHDLARLPKTLRAFCLWDDAYTLARAGEGELLAWGDEPIRYRHRRHGDSHRRSADVVIVKLHCDDRRTLENGLATWADWLDDHDARPGWSLGGSSMNLLRATLAGPLVTTNGELPPARWTLGGRQQAWVEPGTTVPGAIQLDLPAAYTHVVGRLRYGGAWRRTDDRIELAQLDRFHRAGYPILARARGILPDGLHVGPLARRPARRPDGRVEELAPTVPYPVSGRFQGLWTWDELSQAVAAGAQIRILEAWVHAGADYPFMAWHDAIMAGRALGGFAGQLAKATGNALWGQFVIDGRKRLCVQRWNGGRYTSTPVQGSHGHQKRAWDIGELVCGQVRAKLYRALNLCADGLVCCHTDGLWVRDSYRAEVARVVLEEEGWRIKSEASRLDLIDQQKYRYRLRRHRSDRVVCSGVPAARSEAVFAELWERYSSGESGSRIP